MSDWDPEPEPFGNAGPLDMVALDVKQQIARRLGADVLIGRLPDDLAAVQATLPVPEGAKYEPFEAFVIAWDGSRCSGWHRKSTTSGYPRHYWLDRIGPDTVVFDMRTMTIDDAIRFAVRGPMLDVTLPAGKVSMLEPRPKVPA